MPRGDSDRFSTAQMTVTVLVPAHQAWARVCVEGEVDQAAEAALAGAAERLATAGVAAVHVDIAAVTFAGSTLPNFLARLHGHVPQAALFVCHPARLHQRIIDVTGLSGLARRCPGGDEHVRTDVVPAAGPDGRTRRHGEEVQRRRRGPEPLTVPT